MNNIRKGKTLNVSWDVTVNGEIEELDKEALCLILETPYYDKIDLDFEVEAPNTIKAKIDTCRQPIGDYNLTLWYKYNDRLKSVVDSVEAFTLVNYTNQENEPTDDDIVCPCIQLEGNLEVSAKGDKGDKGDSAYDIAVQHGYTGSESEWLDSLHGESAYEIAVEKGYKGTETEWLASLKGEKGGVGDSVYQTWLDDGHIGGYDEFLNDMKIKGDKGDQGIQGIQGDQGIQGIQGVQGEEGLSAYQVAVKEGFVGTESEWLESLKGKDGKSKQRMVLEVKRTYDEEMGDYAYALYYNDGRVGGQFIYANYDDNDIVANYQGNIYNLVSGKRSDGYCCFSATINYRTLSSFEVYNEEVFYVERSKDLYDIVTNDDLRDEYDPAEEEEFSNLVPTMSCLDNYFGYKVVKLTQEAYDALSDDEKNNGKLYMIIEEA